MKVKKAVVGRVRMLERPPRSDEGQLGQSIPQPVVAAAIERARRTAKREKRWTQGVALGVLRGCSGREDGWSMGLRGRRRDDGARAKGRRGSEGTRAEVAAGRMSRGWQSARHPRADHRRPSRRGWRYDRRHPLRVAWLLSASPNVRPTLCAESACGRALYHNVIELAVLPRVPVVVDFVGLLKKRSEEKTNGRGGGQSA